MIICMLFITSKVIEVIKWYYSCQDRKYKVCSKCCPCSTTRHLAPKGPQVLYECMWIEISLWRNTGGFKYHFREKWGDQLIIFKSKLHLCPKLSISTNKKKLTSSPDLNEHCKMLLPRGQDISSVPRPKEELGAAPPHGSKVNWLLGYSERS